MKFERRGDTSPFPFGAILRGEDEFDTATRELVQKKEFFRGPRSVVQPHSRVFFPQCVGERGVFFGDVVSQLPASAFQRPRAHATGRAGDVFLCHPFIVHRATWPHHGTGPRMVAQPAVAIHEPFALRTGPAVCPVERAILRGLER